MEPKKLLEIIEQWEQMTCFVLELKRIPSKELQDLLKESYKALQFYCTENLVPKEICKLLLEMDEFLYFASLIEKKEVEIDFYFYQVLHMIVEALKKGFFEGRYECGYPILEMSDQLNALLVFDFENGNIKELI